MIYFDSPITYWRFARGAFVGLELFDLHFFFICLFCSQEGSLLFFSLSFLVIWLLALHSPQAPFSYLHAFLHFFSIVLVNSHVVWSPFFRVKVLERMLVFESQSDQAPFTYLHGSRFFVPLSLRMRTSWSSSSQISPSATARVTKTTVKTQRANHFISV